MGVTYTTATGATYVPLATYTATGSITDYTFSSISTAYTDLVLVSNVYFASSGIRYVTMQWGNGSVDTNTNYSDTYMDVYSGSPGSGRNTSVNFALISYTSSAGMATTDSQYSMTHFMNYSNTTTYKTTITRNMVGGTMTGEYVNLWRSTSAINTIKVISNGANFASGSTFALYGILGA